MSERKLVFFIILSAHWVSGQPFFGAGQHFSLPSRTQWWKSAIQGEFWTHICCASDFFPPSAVSLGRFFIRASSSSRFLLFLLAQNGAQTLIIACHNDEDNIALESVNAMIGAFVQAVNAQDIDNRFDSRVLTAQANKFRIGFAGFVGFG